MLIINQANSKYFFWDEENQPRSIANLELIITQPLKNFSNVELRCYCTGDSTEYVLGDFKTFEKACEVLKEIQKAATAKKEIYHIPQYE